MQVNPESLIDLTSLNDADTADDILSLCQKAKHVAAVCVFPRFVETAVAALQSSTVKIATVANFPRGEDQLDDVLSLIKTAVKAGAQEVDVVWPYSRYLAGEKEFACHFIRECKKTGVLLKVILETGVLEDAKIISAASHDAISSGADFLKTSTGKVAVGATLTAAEAMLLAIKHSGKPVGFKASGGIRSAEQAMEYIALAERIMGPNWVSAKTFRIGTSRLLNFADL